MGMLLRRREQLRRSRDTSMPSATEENQDDKRIPDAPVVAEGKDVTESADAEEGENATNAVKRGRGRKAQ